MTFAGYREKALLQSIAERIHGNVVHITDQRGKIMENVTSVCAAQVIVAGYDHYIQRRY